MVASQNDSVLLVTSASADQQSIAACQTSIKQQAGTDAVPAFEAIERIAEAPLAKSSYTKIYSNIVVPSISTHSPQVLSRFLSTLSANGTLELVEPVALSDLPQSLCPITRKESELVSLLKLTGFVDVQVVSVNVLSDEDLTTFIKTWGAKRVEQGVAALSGKLGLARMVVKKPAYEVGQKVALNFGKKKAAAKKSVWTVSGNDEDEAELEDDDALLDEEDRIKPSKESLARPDDCELTDGRRKACKNCTCGRAEMDDDEESNNVVSLDLMEDDDDNSDDVVDVDPTSKSTGGCGSCALGDAFRCSTCPYLGMPAFNPGEKITLGGMFEKDDIDI